MIPSDAPVVQVTRKGADRWHNGHPWIFRSDVMDTGNAKPGDLVRVQDHRRKSIGIAQYSSTSQIAIRMLGNAGSHYSIADRIRAAQRLRDRLVHDTNAYRLVHAEADALPALIIDRYGDCFTVQALNQAMDRALPQIVEALVEQFHPRAVVARNDAAVRTLEDLPRETRLLFGDLDQPTQVRMGGIRMEADLLRGQKTGIYLDQRENYRAAARLATGKALDCFTSSGGFALNIARNCSQVEAVDSSEPALKGAQINAEANGIQNITLKQADVFELLSSYSQGRKSFDTVILDPPAFAKSRAQMEGAARGYKDLTHRALKLIPAGGLLVSCSCSHHVSEGMLLEITAEASLDAQKPLRILERRTQSPDHPILLTVPETHYLKCLLLQVV